MSITVGITQTGERVHIGKYDPSVHSNALACAYGHRLIAKRGDKIAHHYAHESGAECSGYRNNKGEWHVAMQSIIDDACVEIPMADEEGKVVHVADALCEGRVIEFQRSPISTDAMREREWFYTKAKGHRMCWVFCCTNDTSVDVVRDQVIGDVVLARWRGGPKFPLMSGKGIVAYLDFGTMDMLRVVDMRTKGKTTRFVARIVRVSEFEREWIGCCRKTEAVSNAWVRQPLYYPRDRILKEEELSVAWKRYQR